MSLRAVLFNAITSPHMEHMKEPKGTCSMPQLDWECPTQEELVQLRGVIASATQHPHASTMVERIMAVYHEQLQEPKLAKDVDPELRGPHGIAMIELIDGARPSSRKPFRMP